ncbi:MAG: 4,5-DOPA dioxygenase extradiol [Salinisphaera sp.]|nr:4,5-DOPA dioxygenase extradiol [Salinisphaera sp.]
MNIHLVAEQFSDAQIGDLLHRCAVHYGKVLDSPMERIRVFVSEHRPQTFFVDGKLASAGAEPAPYFQYIVLQGRPQSEIEALMTGFTDILEAVLGVDRGRIRGACWPVPPEHWGIGGVMASVKRADEVAARKAKAARENKPWRGAVDAQPMPVLFVGHGNPMNAIEDNTFRRTWQRLGAELPRPRAILCVSAHWETPGLAVTASPAPAIIHDFFGFPQALFEVQYAAPGAPELAAQLCRLLREFRCRAQSERGFDHGAWSVLAPMYPKADVPVVQLSLDHDRPPAAHLALAERLAPLRDEGVLILASGNIVHNLSLFDWNDPAPPAWAISFDAKLRRLIEAGDNAALADYPAIGAEASKAVPSAEHYLPLLYAAALRRPDEAVTFFNTELVSTISMTSFVTA